MPVIYHDSDADLGLIMDKQIGIIGYGNMGQAFALNLRDSAFPLLIGNQDDVYSQAAYRDGFEVHPIPQVGAQAQILLILLPDESAPQIYLGDIAPQLRPGDTLVFASGYNIAFGFIEPPPFVDVVLIAPQTIGQGVREGYVEGTGFSSFVAVAQDASGHAWARVLAIAKALGALHKGALEITFQQEAELDLFTQQALMPAFHAVLQTAFEVLNRDGFPPDAAALGLYLSGELGYLLSQWATTGLVESLDLISKTAQYGTLSRIERFKEVKLKRQMESILDTIRRGDFAQEWAAEHADGYPRLTALRHQLQRQTYWDTERDLLPFNQNQPPR